MKIRIKVIGLVAAVTTVLSACGGGGGGSNSTTAIKYAIGGSVTSLSGSGLVLQNNAGDDLAVNGNGTVSFATQLSSGAAYSVTVKTQPILPAQTCSVASGSGTIASAGVNNIAVTCAMTLYTPKFAYVANGQGNSVFVLSLIHI